MQREQQMHSNIPGSSEDSRVSEGEKGRGRLRDGSEISQGLMVLR